MAAGQSKRMNDFKQLLPICGTPMLANVINKVLSFPFERVLGVIGYQAELLMSEIHVEDSRFSWLNNKDYKDGMSTSLKKAAAYCSTQHNGLMVFLGDQPFITQDTIRSLLSKIEEQRALKRVVIQPSYQKERGHPVFLSKELFPHLYRLEGDIGAKQIFSAADIHEIFPVKDKGVISDIDNPKDYFYS
ncbi:nucleotidyltransferase family protein [Salicibibacter cibarius]|uniref:Nucleotidyltransferase family protein n=1 Tax=Salicibibacter cibarius TaxID=2743000 RepID=A0A7T6Z0I7_9BACI|nr:nucleotidyltransferase family protein [Salicibibacter cibarius]